MPRRKPSTTPDPDAAALPGLDPDPTPGAPVRRGPGRPRKVTGAPAARGPGKIPARDSGGRIQSKASLIAKVQTEIELYLTLANSAFMLTDPDCASVVEEAIPGIAQHATALIARNEKMLAMAAKTGAIGEVIQLLGAGLPVVRAIYKAHGPGGTGHQKAEGIDEARYPAYAG